MSISVLLIGAGGTLGHPILLELIRQKASFQDIGILASSQSRALDFSWAKDQGVKVVVGSFSESSSYTGFTHVISCVGSALISSQAAMIDAAIAGGVRHFYPSEWNSDISNPAIADMAYFRDKQEVRAHLATVSERNPGLGYTLMITGIFTEWCILEFFGFDHERRVVDAYGTPDALIGVTSIPDAAKYTVSSLLLPSGAGERTIRVQGNRAEFQSVVDALGEAKGFEYRVKYHPASEARDIERERKLAGDENGEKLWSIRPLVASGFGVADGFPGSRLDSELFDFVPETIPQTFERLLGDLDRR